MANLFETILGAPGAAANAINVTVNTAAEAAKAAINHFLPDPVEQRKAQAAIDQAVRDADYKDAQLGMSGILAEANSADKWTSRARPMFLYVMYGVILLCVLGAILGVWWPNQVTTASQNLANLLAAIPDSLWWLFGTGYLGYTGARSFDKLKAR